ncbi:MAG TPA: aminodeoxychorismate synthase component I [Gammaproteobacteria bacterium]|nr:aminodeoxychorismate synthase component I [Gammaproteobacteria bacterium]
MSFASASPDLVASLPYSNDSTALFALLADQDWAVFLDSGTAETRQGRYDILAADPMTTLVTRGLQTEITTRSETRYSQQDPFDVLRSALGPAAQPYADWPFTGGALGYFSYDLGRRIESLPDTLDNDQDLPEMAVGIYDWVIVVDHDKQQTHLLSDGRDEKTRRDWAGLVEKFHRPGQTQASQSFEGCGQVSAEISQDQYAAAFHQIKRYIVEGDCYQVNLAQRFSTRCDADPWSLYLNLRQFNPAPFSAYLNLPFVQVLSCSPERFIQVSGDQVKTQPIKGTRPRSSSPQQDQAQAARLLNSEKDRAENVMIVDLLRNDMGKNCVTGSVKVPRLFEVQRFATVHHLVSTITGKLAPDSDTLALLRGCFPGGSITGAPKIRAMEIIEALESHRRGIYCGAIGYIDFNGDMDTNICIRTLTYQQGLLHFWAGGGIVHDSTLEGEYQESFDKAAAILKFFGVK